MKMYVISDNQDTLTGLRLGGIEGIISHSANDTSRYIDEVINNNEIGILLINEKLANDVRDKIHNIRMNYKTPLIVEIPDRNGFGRRKDFLTSYINESIGVNI